jgi:hypothetical protein
MQSDPAFIVAEYIHKFHLPFLVANVLKDLSGYDDEFLNYITSTDKSALARKCVYV